VLTESGYEESLKNSEAAEDQERLANIQELLTAARQFDEQRHGEGHLEEFLESCCLVNDTDAWETSDDRATMMTLHASKGLEFPVVFIVALEEGLLPHQRSRHDLAQTEEERRLLFVGMTRAEQELHLSYAVWRDFRGRRDRAVVSSFVMEMPRDEMQVEVLDEAAAPRYEDAYRGGDESQVVDDLPDWVTETDDEEPTSSPTVSAPLKLHLTTAAELAGAAVGGERFPIEAFHHGMIVRHPEYGLGKIVALGGSGQGRRATVAFASSAGERSFVLSASPLRPAKDDATR
jgi:DNA helicase-2/ATP-dependent DNA helicase PcrA